MRCSTSPYDCDPRLHHARRRVRPPTWPPRPSAEDEARPVEDGEGQPPASTRGTVDQEPLLEHLDPPAAVDDRRFVLVSQPSTDDDGSRAPSRRARHWRRRRPSVAERGSRAHLKPAVPSTPLFAARISTPYAYTKPLRESTAPGPSDSPIPTTPPAQPTGAPFDDSDLDADSTPRLRTERQPARYSFVKSDLHRDDLRTSWCDSPSKTSPAGRDSGQAPRPSKYDGCAPSPQSPSSSLNSSPKHRPSSPQLPIRLRHSPPNTRPSSRGNGTPPTSPPSPARIPVMEAAWHATYPPLPVRDPSRPPSRHGRAETMPAPAHLHVCPSPSRQAVAAFSLPYPVDERPADVFMPPEEHYQFDHATVATGSPAGFSPSAPRQSSAAFPIATRTAVIPDMPSHATNVNSETVQPYANPENERELETRRRTSFDLTSPLPSCPRSTPSRHDDWYSLRGYESFDVCSTCFESSFAKSRFAGDFSQIRLYERPVERICDFSSPWIRIAWLWTIQRRLQSLQLLYMLADIAGDERPCPGDREVGADRVDWYGIPGHKEGTHVANFAICSCDKKMLEALFPSMRRCFTRLPTSHSYDQGRHICSLRTSSRRSRTYLDLLLDLDAEAQSLIQAPDISRFIRLVRDNAYKRECSRDKALIRKPWHFIPSLPEFTVCEECYDQLVWPAMHSRVSQSTIPHSFNKTIQLVPGEDAGLGSSCYLYSPRMRRVWDSSIRTGDFSYLSRKVLERKHAESSLSRERKGIMNWMVQVEKGSRQWERAKSELNSLDREWAVWE